MLLLNKIFLIILLTYRLWFDLHIKETKSNNAKYFEEHLMSE